MPYGTWKHLDSTTMQAFGYIASDLTHSSTKPIWVKCQECGIITKIQKQHSHRLHRCKSVINGRKKCFKCKRSLLVSEFSKNRSTYDGFQKMCKDCFANEPSVQEGYKKKSRKIRESLHEYFRYKCNNIRHRAKLKGLSCTITAEDLCAIYNQQDGMCYYSGIKLQHNRGIYGFDSLSVDRIDPAQGYVRSNIVLCSYAINSFKGQCTQREFCNLLKQVMPQLIKFCEE